MTILLVVACGAFESWFVMLIGHAAEQVRKQHTQEAWTCKMLLAECCLIDLVVGGKDIRCVAELLPPLLCNTLQMRLAGWHAKRCQLLLQHGLLLLHQADTSLTVKWSLRAVHADLLVTGNFFVPRHAFSETC